MRRLSSVRSETFCDHDSESRASPRTFARCDVVRRRDDRERFLQSQDAEPFTMKVVGIGLIAAILQLLLRNRF